MKYIRTKNFIHDSKDVVVVNENGTLVVLQGIDKDFVERTHGRTWNTGTNVVLAQADTIEELVEEYYYASYLHEEYPYTPRRCIKIDNVWRDYDNFGRLGETEIKSIKAGIWTDKGLIYVAKINEERGLELL